MNADDQQVDQIPPDMLEESPFSPGAEEADPQPRVREEPIRLGDAFVDADRARSPVCPIGDGSYERPVFGTSAFDPKTSPHPFDGMCKVCSMAEPPRETKLELLWRNCDHKAVDGRWLYRGWLPVNCCETCYEDAKRDNDTLERQRQWWEDKCPIEFRDEWDNRKGNAKLFSRVMQFDVKQRRGLLIHGPTDSGKTRVVWRLLRKLAEEGHEWLFVESIDLMDTIPDGAFTVPVLVIDDLGNDAPTGQKAVKLLKVLRTRANWHRPVIITTQFTGDSLAKQFSETATAQAIIRRLRAFCDDVTAKPFTPGVA